MSNERWDELDAILDQALDLEPSKRAEFLRDRCSDPEQRTRLERLIQAAETEGIDDLVQAGALHKELGPAPSPDAIEGYRFIRHIGAGGMGEVWEAEQLEPVRRRLAVKLVRPGLSSPEILSRFMSERQTLARMSHPGIAQVFDAGVTASDRPFFAMEFVDGRPITDYAEDAGLSLSQRLRLFTEVCDAVHHAHQKGVIHRDIKPANVLVSVVDGRPLPKVIDFGIARAVEGSLSRGTLVTEVGQIVGTPEYMSPEQAAEDPGDVDTRADVYALGVLLFELSTGALPFERRGSGPASLAGLFKDVREEEPPRPSSCASGGKSRLLRGDLDWITLRALHKDRSRRYGSAAEFAEDIRRHLRDEPVLAGPPTAAYRIKKFARRNAGLLTAVVAVLIALVAGLIGTGSGLVRARHEAKRARTEASISAAANQFINQDLLAAVAPDAQGRDVTMSQVLDAAADRLDGRFEDQPEVEATLRGTIGDTYTRLGRFDDAAPQLERSLGAFEAALGPDDPRTLDALHTLAELRYYQGRVDEAGTLLLRLVEARQRTSGPDDAKTLSAMSDLGAVAHDRGRFDEAERYYREALERSRAALGEDSTQTQTMLHNLGALLRDRGRFDEAEVFLRQSWEASRAKLGDEHPETLSTLSMLGSTLREAQRQEEAAPIYTRVFELRRRVLGDEHPQTLLSANNLAMLNKDLGQFDAAERFQRLALEGQIAALGEDHDSTILSYGNLGAILTASGRADEAEPLLAKTVTRARRVVGATHPLTGNTLRKHGDALVALDRHADAERVLLEAHTVIAGSLGVDHPDARRIAAAIASNYLAWGRNADAEAWKR